MKILILTLALLTTPVSAERPLAGFSLAIELHYNQGCEMYTQEDLELMAEVMYWENYPGIERMTYTAGVVLNRVKHDWFPDTIYDVLYQRGQYSTTGKFFTTAVPESVYELARQILVFGVDMPENVVFQSMFRQGSGPWKIIEGEWFCHE